MPVENTKIPIYWKNQWTIKTVSNKNRLNCFQFPNFWQTFQQRCGANQSNHVLYNMQPVQNTSWESPTPTVGCQSNASTFGPALLFASWYER